MRMPEDLGVGHGAHLGACRGYRAGARRSGRESCPSSPSAERGGRGEGGRGGSAAARGSWGAGEADAQQGKKEARRVRRAGPRAPTENAARSRPGVRPCRVRVRIALARERRVRERARVRAARAPGEGAHAARTLAMRSVIHMARDLEPQGAERLKGYMLSAHALSGSLHATHGAVRGLTRPSRGRKRDARARRRRLKLYAERANPRKGEFARRDWIPIRSIDRLFNPESPRLKKSRARSSSRPGPSSPRRRGLVVADALGGSHRAPPRTTARWSPRPRRGRRRVDRRDRRSRRRPPRRRGYVRLARPPPPSFQIWSATTRRR